MHDDDIVALVDGVKREIDRVRLKTESMGIVVQSVIACLHNEGILEVDLQREFLKNVQRHLGDGGAALEGLVDSLEEWIGRLFPE